MFKRKDWVFLRRGQGAGGDASSSSSESGSGGISEEDELSSSSTSKSPEESMNDMEDILNDISTSDDVQPSISPSDEQGDNSLADQVAKWCEAIETGQVIKGRPLRCKICTGKKLLLNSNMYSQHISSGKHRENMALHNFDQGDCSTYFSFAEECHVVREDVETHAERLVRIQNIPIVKHAGGSTKHSDGNKKRRKARPGKRQRQQTKALANPSNST